MILIIFVDTRNVSSACWVLTFKRTCTPHVFSVWNICFRLSFTHESSQVVILWNQLTDEIRPHAASWSWPWREPRRKESMCGTISKHEILGVFLGFFCRWDFFWLCGGRNATVRFFCCVCVCGEVPHMNIPGYHYASWAWNRIQVNQLIGLVKKTSLGVACVEAATAVCWQPCQVYRVCQYVPVLGLASEPVMESCEINPRTKIIQINEGKLNPWILESTWTCLDLGKSEANHWASDLFSSLYSYDSSRAAFPALGDLRGLVGVFHRSNFTWSGDAKLKRTKCRNSDPRAVGLPWFFFTTRRFTQCCNTFQISSPSLT